MDLMPGMFEAAGAEGDAYVLIWTTTPWTLPANTAVSLAPDADYVMVVADGSNLIMARELVEQVAEIAGWESYDLVRGADGEPVALKGREFTGLTYTCPIRQDLKGTVIYGDHVTLEPGTGAVHTAPGHGQDDYLVALEFDVPLLMPVDDNGVLTDEAGPFAGLDVDEANPAIIEWLRERGTLMAEKKILHSYPHCWRCHEPVIFRATDQWFVSMDKNSLREDALDAIDHKVEFIPAWAKNRIGSMVADRPDWCISRQRSWGVPIPVFKCAKCGNTVATAETFDAVIDLFYREGADAWFTHEPSEYLPRGVKCETCGSSELVPEKDILDVWWESGVSHTSVLKHRADEGLRFPADMYLEGSDQHRGWFQSSLLTSMGAYGVPPYKSVMHCGFTMDAEGKKMSKSAGNGVDPADVMAKSGADVLRLWVASVDYSQDVNIGDEILERTSEAYRRIRNTMRFLLGSLSDFDDLKHTVTDWNALEPVDQWAMVRLWHLLVDVERAYDEYKFHMVYRAVYDYIVGDLSAVYMDATKDRVYSEAPDSPRRRAAQTVLMNIVEVLVRVLAPVLSFTTDEVWEHYPEAIRSREGRPGNVQLAGWPEKSDFAPALPGDADAERIAEDFGVILGVREIVTKALEDARGQKIVNKSQEADVTVTAPRSVLDHVEQYDAAVFEELFHRGVGLVRRRRAERRFRPAEVRKTTARGNAPRAAALRRTTANSFGGIARQAALHPSSRTSAAGRWNRRPRPKAFRPFRTTGDSKPPGCRKKPGALERPIAARYARVRRGRPGMARSRHAHEELLQRLVRRGRGDRRTRSRPRALPPRAQHGCGVGHVRRLDVLAGRGVHRGVPRARGVSVLPVVSSGDAGGGGRGACGGGRARQRVRPFHAGLRHGLHRARFHRLSRVQRGRYWRDVRIRAVRGRRYRQPRRPRGSLAEARRAARPGTARGRADGAMTRARSATSWPRRRRRAPGRAHGRARTTPAAAPLRVPLTRAPCS